MKKLKRAVIKEELVALTGDFKKAIVLNQMIYWSERTKDADKFMKDELKRSEMAMGKEERERAEILQEMNLLSHGWIYKTAEEMSEETMMKVSKTTMGTYLKELVEKGWLDKRKNPVWKGDNTFQYRVNLIQIQTDLQKLGYALEGYPLLINEFKNETSESNNLTSDNYPSPVIEHRSSEIGSIVQKLDRQSKNWTTLPETTTEITSETTLKISSSRESIDSELKLKYPDKPFEQIKEALINDETAVIDTDKQYKAMLDGRLKKWQPRQLKQSKSSNKGKQKSVREEYMPDHMKEDYKAVATDKTEQEKEREKMEELLKKLEESKKKTQ